MKQLPYLLLLSFLAISCSSTQMAVTVPPQQQVEISYPGYEVTQATLKNRSANGINVAVLSKADDHQLRGFGLGNRGAKETVMVEDDSKLVLHNTSDKAVQIRISMEERDDRVFERSGDYISFTLQNKSTKSIPLLIPGVMNPNLSPLSKSGVDLKMGQEIQFRAKGKTHVLFTVDENIQPGMMVDVAKLLDERKKALGL